MATINGLTTLASADIATGDYLPIYDASAATDKKTAAGSFAIIDVINTFAVQQRMEGVAGTPQFVVNAPSGHTGSICAIGYNAVYGLNYYQSGSVLATILSSLNLGNNTAAPYIEIGRNSNSSSEGGAAGTIGITQANGSATRYLWSDNSGNLRIHNAKPTGSTGSPTVNGESAGTVVGTQTSSLDSKYIAGNPMCVADVLAAVQAGAEAVRRFTYRSGAFNGEEFSGVVIDYAPRYGMDRDADHAAGKSLNVVTVIGDLLIAVASLAERVAALEAGQNG